MAVSTAEAGPPDRVTERGRRAKREKQRRGRGWDERERERERQRKRETSPKRVSGVPRGGQSDAISLWSPPSLHVDAAFCHI